MGRDLTNGDQAENEIAKDGTRVDPRMTRSERLFMRLSVLQTVIAALGILTGGIALFAALNESDAVRKQQQAAVWPHVQFEEGVVNNRDDRTVSIKARNNGIGPARIKSIRVSAGGVERKSWREVVDAVYKTRDRPYAVSNLSIGNSVLAAGETVELFQLSSTFTDLVPSTRETVDKATYRAMAAMINEAYGRGDIGAEICYCSVFDACWRVTTRSVEPESIKACEAAPLDQNEF